MRALLAVLAVASLSACGRVSGDDPGAVGHRDDAAASEVGADETTIVDAHVEPADDTAEVGHGPFRVRWARQAHATSIADPLGLLLTPTGDLVVAGLLSGAIDFGSGPLHADSSAYVARLSADGVTQWSTTVDRSPCDRFPSGAALVSDSIWVVGAALGARADGGCWFNGDPDGVADAVAWRVSLDGAVLPGSPISIVGGGKPGFTGAGSVIALDDGTAVVRGGWRGKGVFADGTFESSASRLWTASFGGDGGFRWVRRRDDSPAGYGFGSGVAVPGGYVLFGGFSGTIDLGTGPLKAGSPRDLLLASFDGGGAIRWARRYDGTAIARPGYLARDKSGDLVATANANGVVTFGPTPLTTRGRDGLVMRFSADGSIVAATLVGTDGDDNVQAPVIDDGGDVFVCGFAEEAVSRDDAGGVELRSRATIDRLSASLVEKSRWTSPAAPFDPSRPSSASAGHLAVRGGTLFVAGSFSGDLTLGATTLSAPGLTDPAKGPTFDAFVAAFEP